MALNAKPILSTIAAFDAAFTSTDEAPILKFSWKDGVIKQNRVVIRDAETNEKVYDCTISTMALKHQLHKFLDTQQVPYNLQNGHQYVATVSVYTADGEWSLFSNEVKFYCYSTPRFEFINFQTFIDDGKSIAVVNHNSVNLVVEYEQENEEPLDNYKFELYDYTGKLLIQSETKYSSLYHDRLRYTLGGFEETETYSNGDIIPNREYRVVCLGETKHGIAVQVEQKFIVKFITSGVGALVEAKNVGDGTVVIYSNYKIINANCSVENPTYLKDENGNSYAIDLTNGEYVEFLDGFNMKIPYEIIVKGIFKTGLLITFTNTDNEKGYLKLNEITYTTSHHYYYFSFIVSRNGIQYEIRSNYFEKKEKLVNAEIDLLCINGLHNIKVKIDGQEV